MTNCFRVAIGILTFSVALGAGPEARAQVLGVHGIYVPAQDERRASIGVQADIGGFIPVPFVDAMLSLGVEYQRQRDLGPGRGRAAAELRIFRRNGDGFVAPFVGGGISANQSNGSLSEWHGTLAGFEAMAGLILVPSDRVPVALLLEERFGYVREQNHATATHVGVLIKFH
jgi:hypothetical protein